MQNTRDVATILGTVDFQMGSMGDAAGGTIGDAGILAGVLAPHRGYREGRDTVTHWGYAKKVRGLAGLDPPAVEEPLQGEGRVALHHGAVHDYEIAGVGALMERERLQVWRNCKEDRTGRGSRR